MIDIENEIERLAFAIAFLRHADEIAIFLRTVVVDDEIPIAVRDFAMTLLLSISEGAEEEMP